MVRLDPLICHFRPPSIVGGVVWRVAVSSPRGRWLYDLVMTIPTAMVGSVAGPLTHTIDERWTMAYAAGIGDRSPRYLDTTDPVGVVAHPLFPVCVEWPVVVAARSAYERFGVTGDEVRTGVHATHDLTIHRLVRPGDVLSTRLETVGVVAIGPGALVTTRLRTVDQHGAPVATTTQDAIHLGVPTDGHDRPDPQPPAAVVADPWAGGIDRDAPVSVEQVVIDAGRAHIYTECARIWNPIHTDTKVAQAAGLPDIILHGTANAAYGLSHALTAVGADPADIRRIRCRFRAMVRLPSTITIRVWAPAPADGGQVVAFEVLNQDGDPAVQSGLMVLDRGAQPGHGAA